MWLFILIGVVLMIMTMLSNESAGSFIQFSYVLLFLSVLAVVMGIVMTAVSNPRKMLGSLIGGVAMAIIFGISYALAGNEVIKAYGDITPTVSQLSGAGLYMFYILLLGTIGAIIFASVSRLLK